MVKAAKATIVTEEETDFWIDLPDHVKAGIEKGIQQAKNGQIKSFEDVKKILADR